MTDTRKPDHSCVIREKLTGPQTTAFLTVFLELDSEGFQLHHLFSACDLNFLSSFFLILIKRLKHYEKQNIQISIGLVAR